MADRLGKARRILDLQVKIRRMAEWEKQRLDREAAAADREARSLVAAFNGETGDIAPLFADMMARRLQRIAIEMRQIEDASTRQVETIRRETGREKQAARLKVRLAAQSQRAQEDRLMLDIAEAREARRHASLE